VNHEGGCRTHNTGCDGDCDCGEIHRAEQRALTIECATCGAPPGEACSWWSASSSRVTHGEPHTKRIADSEVP